MNSQLIHVSILYLYTQQLAEKFCKIEHSRHVLAFHMLHHLLLSKTIEIQQMVLLDLIDLELLSKVNLLQNKIHYSALEAMSESLYCHDYVYTNLGQGH